MSRFLSLSSSSTWWWWCCICCSLACLFRLGGLTGSKLSRAKEWGCCWPPILATPEAGPWSFELRAVDAATRMSDLTTSTWGRNCWIENMWHYAGAFSQFTPPDPLKTGILSFHSDLTAAWSFLFWEQLFLGIPFSSKYQTTVATTCQRQKWLHYHYFLFFDLAIRVNFWGKFFV